MSWPVERPAPGGTPTPHIAVVSCDEYPDGLGGEAKLPDLLAARGAQAEWAVWSDRSVEWHDFDLVVIRCTWDYPAAPQAFADWVRHVALETDLVNSAALVTGNLHKGYLTGLGDDAVPTVVVPAGMSVELDRLGWGTVVVKPAVAVGGDGVVRTVGQADLDALTLGAGVDAVVQPYLDRIETDGELSVVVVDGEITHAVRKRPARGDFRANEQVGATVELTAPAADDVAVVHRALATLPAPPVVARVDLLRDGLERPRVLEMELIEPYLWLELAPHAADRLADVLVERASTGVGAL